MSAHLTYDGYCPICESTAHFVARSSWLRDDLVCQSCFRGSVPRERALALILAEMRPNWRDLAIHESSPANRGVSAKMAREGKHYTATQFYPDKTLGEKVDIFRNENLEALTFADDVFDITISLDVMEHVYNPDRVFSEIYRTLKPGGIYLCTFPVRKAQVQAIDRRFEYLSDGSRHDIKPAEIHGNPIDGSGSIVTIDWGYDLHQKITEFAPFDVRVHRFCDKTHGILGEYTEVVACLKPQ